MNRLPKELQRLLKLKEELNRKRPEFLATGVWKNIKRVPERWRFPDSNHSKIRLQKKGRPKMPSAGYRNPRAVRGMHPSGYFEVLVHSKQELEGLDPAVHAVRIAATVGKKKRQEIIEEARKRGLKILNA
ncbi:MAG: 50S ribosomal protein L32e [bacterium]|nr:50S ribosomal protein L32e [bacterium]